MSCCAIIPAESIFPQTDQPDMSTCFMSAEERTKYHWDTTNKTVDFIRVTIPYDSGDQVYTYKLPVTSKVIMKAGKEYKITLTVNGREIIKSNYDVEDWTDGSDWTTNTPATGTVD